MKNIFKEFREFAVKGNVIDMAVGIIIGAAFGKVVTSLVSDVVMPPIGKLTGDADFAEHFLTLSGGPYQSLAEAKEAGAATINYGLFINTAIDFLIVAFAVFLLVKMVNNARRQMEREEAAKPVPTPPPPPVTNQEKLLTEIRDLLKTNT